MLIERLTFITRCLLLSVLLTACVSAPPQPEGNYTQVRQSKLSVLNNWQLTGRMALSSPKENWTVNFNWQHLNTEDKLQLSGPLGQGMVFIRLNGKEVSVVRGVGDVLHSDNPDVFVAQQLGVFVPVRALTYWIVGLPEPNSTVQYTAQGFKQGGWQINYTDWQMSAARWLPRKLQVVNEQIKLKMLCDQWEVR